jgi:uncharacterized membrane protein
MICRILFLFFLSMVPIVELRGAIPIGIGWGLPFWQVFAVSVAGNLAVIPVLVPFARHVLLWGTNLPRFGSFFRKILIIGHRKAARVENSRLFFWALYLFVAVPAPGTGAWTGCLIATLLELPVKKVFLPIAAGVVTAGVIMGVTSYGLLNLFIG